MVEKDKLFATKIKDKGIFNFKATYRALHTWLTDESYLLNEKKYKETVSASGAKDVEIKWAAEKKISDYFRFVIKVNWIVLGMTDVEVEIDGVKQKANKGQLELHISTVLEKDYENRWDNRPFFKFLRTLYDRYLIPSRIEKYEAKLLGEMDEFVAQCKAYLALGGKSMDVV